MERKSIATFSFDIDGPNLLDDFNPNELLAMHSCDDGRMLPITTNRIRYVDLFNNLSYDDRYGSVCENNVAGIVLYYAAIYNTAMEMEEVDLNKPQDYFIEKLYTYGFDDHTGYNIINHEYDFLISKAHDNILSYVYGYAGDDSETNEMFYMFVADVIAGLVSWLGSCFYELRMISDLYATTGINERSLSAHVDISGFLVVDVLDSSDGFIGDGFKNRIHTYIERMQNAK